MTRPASREFGSPFDRKNLPDRQQVAALMQALDAAGVRLLPYPFSNIMAIVSDCDYSTQQSRIRSLASLCYQWNIDFADSFGLLDFTETDDIGANYTGDIKGTWSTFCSQLLSPAKQLEMRCRLSITSLSEFERMYHAGFFDHLHGLIPSGKLYGHGISEQRFQWTSAKTFSADNLNPSLLDYFIRLSVEPGVTQQLRDVYFRYIRLECLGSDQRVAPSAVQVILIDGSRHSFYPSGRKTLPGEKQTIVFHPHDKPAAFEMPLEHVDRMEICFDSPNAQEHFSLKSCCLLPLAREDITNALHQLNTATKRPPCLFVDHSSTGLLNQSSAENLMAIRHKANEIAAEYGFDFVIGGIEDDGVDLLADSPGSALHAFGAMCDAGIRFVNPSGTSGQPINSIHPLEVLSPSAGRDGRRVYVARRVLPKVDEQYLDASLPKFIKRKSRLTTFCARLSTALDSLASPEPEAIPFYTHLGADQGLSPGDDPYRHDVIGRLQDHMYNFSGQRPDHERLYVVRASAFYQYLRMIQLVGPKIKRSRSDTISIRKVRDSHLGTKVPESPAELHGLTMRVKDASAAKVYLGRSPIKDVLRIGHNIHQPEEWITVLTGGIRQEVLPRQRDGEGMVPNMLGNIYYIGIQGLGHLRKDASFGVRVFGTEGLEILIGSDEFCHAENQAGCICVKNWALFGKGVAWFSLFTAKWPEHMAGGDAQSCFGEFIGAELLGNSRELFADHGPPRIQIMKPNAMFEHTINPSECGVFPMWLKMMSTYGLGLPRRPNP
jgi:hypothetical protein